MKTPTKEMYSKIRETIKKKIRSELSKEDSLEEAILITDQYLSKYRFSMKQIASLIESSNKEISKSLLKRDGYSEKDSLDSIPKYEIHLINIFKDRFICLILKAVMENYIISEWEMFCKIIDSIEIEHLTSSRLMLLEYLMVHQDVPFHIIHRYHEIIPFNIIIRNKDFSKECGKVIFNDILQLYGYEDRSRFVDEKAFEEMYKKANESFIKNL